MLIRNRAKNQANDWYLRVKVDYEYSVLFRRSKKKLVETKFTQEVMGTKSRDPTFRVPHTQRSAWPSLFRLK